MKFGYARVSSKDQNLALQIEALTKAGCKRIFQEKQSGKNIQDRPELNKLLDIIHEEDIVVVLSLDRLSRNSEDIKILLSQIERKGATFDILDFPSFAGVEDLNLRRLLNNLFIDLMSYTAEHERAKIRERQAEGIKLAKDRGAFIGKQIEYGPNASNPQKRAIYHAIVKSLQLGESISYIARINNVSRSTVYRIKRRTLG
ncbi:recombinase family protein [Lactobacillus sp. W8089]|nr:recombinase family protein [Lactobacillus sp. W8086]MBI0109539.1 recombinase family protein [Lactobacillus sp. W8085]MBI0112737.1 recombinase family protein [Lactobacillus sp. W8088]MBI0116471.1 recombinase family protein [Lactobacillus sp. W8087]MBI0120179.1 recombinase family protein [Lactobacillus sp. W8089]MBI0132161.1 recombinase family protein [Lactobacillus sp. W8090]